MECHQLRWAEAEDTQILAVGARSRSVGKRRGVASMDERKARRLKAHTPSVSSAGLAGSRTRSRSSKLFPIPPASALRLQGCRARRCFST